MSADARLTFPRPVSRPPCSEVLQVAFSPSETPVGLDRLGNPRVSVDVQGVRPGETRCAVMRVRLRLRPLVPDMDARAAAGASLLPADARACLGATPDLPVGAPEVGQVVGTVTDGETNPWYRLVALFDRVRRLHFIEGGRVRSVLDVLKSGDAQCADAAALLATLARAAGTPARTVGGIYTLDDTSSTRDTHVWVEAWMSGVGWVPLDPTMARFDDAARVSRLAAQMKGYVPLWMGTVAPFEGLVTGPAGACADRAEFKVSFSWQVEPAPRGSSLLEVFPVPRAPAQPRPGSPPPEWLRHDARDAAERKRGPSREEALLAAAAVGAPTVENEVALAAFYVRTRQLGRALSVLQDAIDRDSAAPAPWRTLVSAYGALEIWDGVALAAERAQDAMRAVRPGESPPLHGEMAMVAGQAYMRLGDPARARDAFRVALRAAPDDGWLHAMLGWALRDCGERAQARAELSRGLVLGIQGGERSFFERMRKDLDTFTP